MTYESEGREMLIPVGIIDELRTLTRPVPAPQRYWVETRAKDGGWSPCCPSKADVYRTGRSRWLSTDADEMVAFMDRVIEYAALQSIGIIGARVMQVDPEGRENLYHSSRPITSK